MKKQLLVTALITGLLVGLGATAAQASVDHELRIEIPAVLMIRFALSDATVNDADPVVFAPTAEALAAGTRDFDPEDVDTMNWDDIQVFANTTRDDGFEIVVSTDSGVSPAFDWAKVSVEPSDGDVVIGEFNLPSNASKQIYASAATPVGPDAEWQSLGIGPAAYSLTLDGGEEADDYSTTVTYTIADL